MKIGELAERTGCPVETIRYYERIDLLAPPERGVNNYRSYGESHAERLGFIRHCRALDMSIDEIRTLLGLRERPEQDCGQVNNLIDGHIAEVRRRIAALTALEAQLRDLRSQCGATDAARLCPILNALGSN